MEIVTDVRTDIKSIIGNITPFDYLELAHIKDSLNWIDTAREIFRIEKPATPPKHLVTFTVLVDPSEMKILLFDHRKAGLLLPSGGHVEKNEMPHDAALRELQEELG